MYEINNVILESFLSPALIKKKLSVSHLCKKINYKSGLGQKIYKLFVMLAIMYVELDLYFFNIFGVAFKVKIRQHK